MHGSGLNRILFLLCILLAAVIAKDWWIERQSTHRMRKVQPRGDLAADEQSTIELFKSASPSVVYITSISVEYDRRGFTLNQFKLPSGTGTGFIWNDQGHIVTNFHVIQNAEEAEVTLSDQTVYKASIVGAEPDKDLAVLKINAPKSKLPAIHVGTSSDLQVGQSVFAIGNPFGLDQTLTTGVISGLGREIESLTRRPIQDVIQTDAAINPGNSGGPLLDSAGRLIGVNTAIYSQSGSSAGIGFAVPVDTVNWIVPQIIEHGRAIKPVLGIEIYPTRPGQIEGVAIYAVRPGSGAERAGLVGIQADRWGRAYLGDVIVEVEDEPIADQKSLFRVLDRHRIGDRLKVKVQRGRKMREVEVELTASS